jgi:hypothetical protein
MLARRYHVLPTQIRDLDADDLAFVKLCADAGIDAARDAARANPDAMIFPVFVVGGV